MNMVFDFHLQNESACSLYFQNCEYIVHYLWHAVFSLPCLGHRTDFTLSLFGEGDDGYFLGALNIQFLWLYILRINC